MRAGYKLTEVGVIPEDWAAVPLKGKVGIAHGFAFASEHFASYGPYRLATPGHFYEAGGFRDIGEKQKYYVGPVPSDYVLQPGDVIVAMTEQSDGLLGSAAVIPAEHSHLHNQRLGRVTVRSSDIQLEYLVYVFNSPSYRTKVRETAAGTKVKHTSPEKLLEIFVRLPLLTEQRAIAAALSDVDALLAKLEQLIAKKRDLKQAAMQQLLTGQTRLPGFEGAWEVVRAGDVGQFRGGSGFPIKYQGMKGGEYPLFKVSDMNNVGNEIFMETANNFIDEVLRKKLGATVFPAGSIVLAKVGAAVFLERKKILSKASCLDNNMAAFVMDSSRANCRFIHYAMLNKKLGNLVSTTALPSLSGTILSAIEIALPPLAEQTAIAAVLSDMDTDLAALEARRDKTRALKQGMMQELLTGRIRLVSPEAINNQKVSRDDSNHTH